MGNAFFDIDIFGKERGKVFFVEFGPLISSKILYFSLNANYTCIAVVTLKYYKIMIDYVLGTGKSNKFPATSAASLVSEWALSAIKVPQFFARTELITLVRNVPSADIPKV